MYDVSAHVVEVSGVLLIIVRGYRWLKVDWLLVLVLIAMVAPLYPRTWKGMVRGPEPETSNGDLKRRFKIHRHTPLPSVFVCLFVCLFVCFYLQAST